MCLIYWEIYWILLLFGNAYHTIILLCMSIYQKVWFAACAFFLYLDALPRRIIRKGEEKTEYQQKSHMILRKKIKLPFSCKSIQLHTGKYSHASTHMFSSNCSCIFLSALCKLVKDVSRLNIYDTYVEHKNGESWITKGNQVLIQQKLLYFELLIHAKYKM